MQPETYQRRLLAAIVLGLISVISGSCASPSPAASTATPANVPVPQTQATTGQKPPQEVPTVAQAVSTGVPQGVPTVPRALPTGLPQFSPVPPLTVTSQAFDPATTFEATTKFVRPLSVDELVSFVMQTGARLLQTTFTAVGTDGNAVTFDLPAVKSEPGKSTQFGGLGFDRQGLTQMAQDKGWKDVLAQHSDALMDKSASEKVNMRNYSVIEGGPPKSEAQVVVDNWKKAWAVVRTVRGSQSFMAVQPDGSRIAVPLSNGDPAPTDEVYDATALSTGGQTLRYRFTAHYLAGDMTTIFDGKRAYRYATWWKEVYSPLPESSGQYAYWSDDTDDRSLFPLLQPSGYVAYTLVGRTRLDGRDVIELAVPADGNTGNYIPNGAHGQHIYLDAATYLPYRIVSFQQIAGGKVGNTGYEVTLNNLQVNGPVSDADFTLQLPPGTPIVYEPAPSMPATSLAVYANETEAARAAQDAGFTLFVPETGAQGEIYARYITEKDGKRAPVISLLNDSVLEGLYLPQRDYLVPLDPGTAVPSPTTTTTVTIDGQPATLHTGFPGGNSLTFQKDGTLIRITGFETQNQAVQIARSLRALSGK